jgi:hypothetical protein
MLVGVGALLASGLASLTSSFVGASSSVPSSSERWSIVPSPNVTEDFNNLNAISCVGPSFCAAIGSDNTSNTDDTLVELWNASDWSVAPSPASIGPLLGVLYGVSCVNATFCMAVGGDTAGSLAESWNGVSWSVIPTPSNEGTLSSVSCTASNFCMAVGSTPSPTFGPLAEQWNGSDWTVVATPSNPFGDEVSLNSVSCASKSSCETVGIDYVFEAEMYHEESLAESWNGQVWSSVPTVSPPGKYLYGVSCPQAAWCMAVGFSGEATTLAELWNGSVWSEIPSPSTGMEENDNLLAVSCTGQTFCNAVGYANAVAAGGSFRTLSESWNGASWSIVPSPNPPDSFQSILEGVSCTAPELCNAGGRWYGMNPLTATQTLIESVADQVLGGPVVGISADPAPGGYLVVAADGGVAAFEAPYFGAMGSIHLNQPIVGMAATRDAEGYWLVAADGGIFTFGDAAFYGSTGSIHLNQPIVGMAATPDGKGYWLVAADGGIFTFGDAGFYGSAGSLHLNKPIVGMAATSDGKGYWLVAADGGIFTFGDAQFYGTG